MKNKILEMLRANNGIITTKQVKDENIDTTYLSIMNKEGSINRVGRGVYIDPNEMSDEYFNISTVTEESIFSHSTSLYLHDLSDRVPLKYDVTVPHGYGGSLIRNDKVKLFYIKKENFKLGKIKVETPNGNEVNAYDTERTLCDMLRSENRVDKDITINAFKQYLRSDKRDLYKLKKYAKELKITKKLDKYLEVLL